MSTFDTTKIPLPQILSDITLGRIQLPDFQRGWVWDDQHIKSLLVSIGRSFPVGAVMMLEAGGELKFQTRPIEGVSFPLSQPKPDYLILDGQQRLTSLWQVLSTHEPVQTFNNKGAEVRLHYYINLKKALEDGSLENAFISVPEDRRVKTNFNRDILLDLSTHELELNERHFPCSQILDPMSWILDLASVAPEESKNILDFQNRILTPYTSYQIPVITLGKSTTSEAVCLVFEKVNTGGITLSVFEILTAKLSAEGYKLREDWFGNETLGIEGRQKRLTEDSMLEPVQPTDFLQAVSLLRTYELRQKDLREGKTGKQVSPVSAKRSAILSLDKEAYEKYAPIIENGFRLAGLFMRKQCFYSSRELPYRTQLVPLAVILSQLGERWLQHKFFDDLSRWYWCGVLGELYGGAVETRMANDFEDLMRWLGLTQSSSIEGANDELPRTISDAAFQESRLDTLRSRNSAAYKGLSVLVLREGAKDFFYKSDIQSLDHMGVSVDIHHIFPKKWCIDEGIKPSIYNSVINKTPISAKANRLIGGKSPSEYLARLQSHPDVNISVEEMNQILTFHQIPYELLRINNFNEFYRGRKDRLIRLIEKTTGKTVQRDQSDKLEIKEL
ncbi:MAG: DUF262 domain-containing protein [Bacteroidetes bacterium]|nr:DUF262 domain-containing protein [Bacteroidota bacterium]